METVVAEAAVRIERIQSYEEDEGITEYEHEALMSLKACWQYVIDFDCPTPEMMTRLSFQDAAVWASLNLARIEQDRQGINVVNALTDSDMLEVYRDTLKGLVAAAQDDLLLIDEIRAGNLDAALTALHGISRRMHSKLEEIKETGLI